MSGTAQQKYLTGVGDVNHLLEKSTGKSNVQCPKSNVCALVVCGEFSGSILRSSPTYSLMNSEQASNSIEHLSHVSSIRNLTLNFQLSSNRHWTLDIGHWTCRWTLDYVFRVGLPVAPVLLSIPELPGCPVETPCPSASRGPELLTGSSFAS